MFSLNLQFFSLKDNIHLQITSRVYEEFSVKEKKEVHRCRVVIFGRMKLAKEIKTSQVCFKSCSDWCIQIIMQYFAMVIFISLPLWCMISHYLAMNNTRP